MGNKKEWDAGEASDLRPGRQCGKVQVESSGIDSTDLARMIKEGGGSVPLGQFVEESGFVDIEAANIPEDLRSNS